MTCTSCGKTLPQDVHFCTHCGAPAPVQPPSAAPYGGLYAALGYDRVSRHLQIAGILWIVYAFERTISKLIGLVVLHHIFPNWETKWGSMGDFSFTTLWPVIVVSIVIGLVLCLLTGYALLTKQPWGRIIAIITSILALIHPIFGTALGIYTLWVLAPAASGVEYETLTHATPR